MILIILIQSVIRELTLQGKLQEKSIIFSPDPDLPCIFAIPGQIREVIYNLISNAIKYTNEYGAITIQAQVATRMVKVSVIDDGIGIDNDQLDDLFKPFFRVKREDTEDIDGSGIGLYLVKQIIERHQGDVGATSTLDKGSTFHFSVPSII